MRNVDRALATNLAPAVVAGPVILPPPAAPSRQHLPALRALPSRPQEAPGAQDRHRHEHAGKTRDDYPVRRDQIPDHCRRPSTQTAAHAAGLPTRLARYSLHGRGADATTALRLPAACLAERGSRGPAFPRLRPGRSLAGTPWPGRRRWRSWPCRGGCRMRVNRLQTSSLPERWQPQARQTGQIRQWYAGLSQAAQISVKRSSTTVSHRQQ
jgi:hypothetical protein